jgi:alkylation response protein AidB-like acyl-CoA dehydrogenase
VSTTLVPPALEQVAAHFAARASAVDAGRADVRDGLRWLGQHNLLDPPGATVTDRAALLECVAGSCLSSAFSAWAQLMVGRYLAESGHGGDVVSLRDGLRSGQVVGCTAMAAALRDIAGLEPVPVTARRTAAGLVVNGPIRWASNLFADAVVVLAVRLPSDGRAVVRVRLSDPGVRPKQPPELLALNATASGSVELRDVLVPEDQVLDRDLAGFVRRVRPEFLVLQSAFCVGLARRSARAADGQRLSGANQVLAGDVAALCRRVDAVRAQLYEAAAAPASAELAELLRLRLDAARLAVQATRLEATVRGGAGYLADGDVSRRLREAAFLPIQAPTEGQLRWELSRCG